MRFSCYVHGHRTLCPNAIDYCFITFVTSFLKPDVEIEPESYSAEFKLSIREQFLNIDQPELFFSSGLYLINFPRHIRVFIIIYFNWKGCYVVHKPLHNQIIDLNMHISTVFVNNYDHHTPQGSAQILSGNC